VLDRFLGRGGFGEVWKATAPGGIPCALKIISLNSQQGLKEFRALRLVKEIRHPNCVPISAFWLKDQNGRLVSEDTDASRFQSQGGELIIAMGLGDRNLFDRFRECVEREMVGIPFGELLRYMEEAAKAIDFLNQPTHDLGAGPVSIQHCDIKPQNILLVGGSVQVCDFGLARVLSDEVRRNSEAAGTYAYMPPEQMQNRPSKSTDQYSLALSYMELRTGKLPFPSTSIYAVMQAKLNGELDFSALPSNEQAILQRATALDPDKRFGSTEEMVEALRDANRRSIPRRPRPPSELLQPGVEIVPGYQLIRLLGRGGFGEVWEAAGPGFGKKVAIKIIQNLQKLPSQQEFKALELLKEVEHPYLMELLAYWLLDEYGEPISDSNRSEAPVQAPNMLVVATKLAKKNLRQRLDECRKGPDAAEGIPPGELLRYMRQTATVIDYLNTPCHKLGGRLLAIQHRDIKPDNILLEGGSVKLGDFGLAKVIDGTVATIHDESAGLTLAYAAPELFQNKLTSWSDQYALAISYYHLRTGSLPFEGGSPADFIESHTKGNLEFGKLPTLEQAVIRRATSLVPEQRFSCCMEMITAMEKALGEDVVPGSAETQTEVAGETSWKTTAINPARAASQKQSPKKWVFGISSLVAAGLVVLLILKLLEPKPPEEIIGALIADKHFEEAYAQIEGFRSQNDVPLALIEELHERNAAAWLATAEERFKTRFFDGADEIATRFLSCYEQSSAASGALDLRQRVQQRKLQLKGLLEQGQQHLAAAPDLIHPAAGASAAALGSQPGGAAPLLTSGLLFAAGTADWTLACQIALQLGAEFPEHKKEAGDLREQAIAQGRRLSEAAVKVAEERKSNWEVACWHYYRAYQHCKKLEEFDETSTSASARAITDRWLKYGNDLLSEHPDLAMHVAEKLVNVEPRATELRTTAVRRIGELTTDDERRKKEQKAKSLAGDFARVVKDNDPAAAKKCLSEIRALNLSAAALADLHLDQECSGLLPGLASKESLSPKDVLALIEELELWDLPKLAFDLRLARASLHLRSGNYQAYLTALDNCKGAPPDQLDTVLVQGTRCYQDDKKLEVPALVAFMERLELTLKERSSARPKLAAGFCGPGRKIRPNEAS
jgi:serine/threonine protein kinase